MKCSLLTLSCYVDAELPAPRRGELEAHLVGCHRCRAGLGHLREEVERVEGLARVHVPIGLDLGAQSAPEIALAVLAEVLAVQRGATGLPISEKVKRGMK